jgi:hypothetical protein
MLKMFKIPSYYGNYNIIAFNKKHAIRRAYRKFKKSRKNTTLDFFEKSIGKIIELK